MTITQRLKIIVDSMSYHHLTCKDLQYLQGYQTEAKAVIGGIVSCHNYYVAVCYKLNSTYHFYNASDILTLFLTRGNILDIEAFSYSSNLLKQL